jgi:DivIVA domain-containing protein
MTSDICHAVVETPQEDPAGVAGLLTPADIRNQLFKVVRLREGYDLAEVDRFLVLVETTLISVLRENERLRARPAPTRHNGHATGEADSVWREALEIRLHEMHELITAFGAGLKATVDGQVTHLLDELHAVRVPHHVPE